MREVLEWVGSHNHPDETYFRYSPESGTQGSLNFSVFDLCNRQKLPVAWYGYERQEMTQNRLVDAYQ